MQMGRYLLGWLVTVMALYAGALALNRLFRAAVYILVASLLIGFAAYPSDPTTVLRWLWEASREPLGRLAAVLLQLGRLLWNLVLGLLQENH